MIVFYNGPGDAIFVNDEEILAIAQERIRVLEDAVVSLQRFDNCNYLGIVKGTLELNRSLVLNIESSRKKCKR